MGFCSRRHFVLTICVLQIISTVERQVFDFLGFMWGPILANFFQIIFVIFGFFGTYQYRPKYVIAYSVWSFLWIAWNAFIICFYLSVGVLDKDGSALNLGTGSVSWWEVNGAGCRPIYPTNITSEDEFSPLRPITVNGCILNYEYVEVLHAALQVLLACLGGIGGIFIIRVLMEEDDSSSSKKGGSGARPASLYSIEYTPHPHLPDRIDDRVDDHYSEEDDESLDGNQRAVGTLSGTGRLPGPQLSPRPMTPRRVKRRSVNSRGSMPASAISGGTLRGSSGNQHPPTLHRRHQGTSGRSSLRSSGRKSRSQPQHQNPVTRLLIQQQQQQLQQQHQQLQHQQLQQHQQQQLLQHQQQPMSNHQLPPQLPPQLPHQHPPTSIMRLSQTFTGGLGDSSTSNESRPGFTESTSHTDLLLSQDSSPTTANVTQNWRKTGHVNPLYQQSSNQSLAINDEDDDSYNRPPSARSSYSNYHGARALGHLGPSNNYGQAAAQVPVVNSYRRSQNSARQSLRNAAFLSSGPPAYRSQGNLDSETVI